MNTDKTPQEISAGAIVDQLKAMEEMVNLFANEKYVRGKTNEEISQMDKYAKEMRKLINDKSAELLLIKNHLSKPQDKDAREEYIIQVEKENKMLIEENKRLQVIINTGLANDQK